MATKLTRVFDDEILESKKPAGCIGGIFQLFDCQQLLGGKQLSEQDNRRDPSAHAQESPSISLSCKLEKNQSKRYQENPRDSMESSRTSFSSTFTSFSSLEHKSPQKETIYTQHSFFCGRSPRTKSTEINKSPGFKKIIKESIYRDFGSATMKEDDSKKNKVMKSIHSPRLMELSKVDESIRRVFEFEDSSKRFYKGHSPRHSYDGTDVSQAFGIKKYGKHGGLSRLSLDSKEGSLKCNLSPKINSAMKEFDRNVNKRVSATLNQLQDMESNEKNSSIVAKLMGLEPLKSATQNSIKCYERKHEKTLESPRNIAKSPRRNNPYLDSPSKFSIEETPQRVIGYVEEIINQKIESVFSMAEKRIQKLPCHHSSKDLRNLKCVISEAKMNGNRKHGTVNSLSTQLTSLNCRSNKVSIKASKCPIVVMEPARKHVSFSKVIKFEGHPGLEKIRICDSRSNRKKDFLNTQTIADQSFTEMKEKCRGLHSSLSKEPNERAVSPRLQQMKPDLKLKASATVPSYDSSKSPRQPVNSQLLDSVSPRRKLRNKLNKEQDVKLENSGEQINVGAIKANSSIEGKCFLFQQGIQSSTVKVSTGVALVPGAKSLFLGLKHPVILKESSAKVINLVSPQWSCPNSAPNAKLNQDGLLHSPVSVLKEYRNLLSDRTFTMECPPLTIPSTVRSRTNSEISERKNTTIQGSRDLGTSVNEVRVTNPGMFTLEKLDQDSAIVAEIFLVCGLLQQDSDLISMLEQIATDRPSEFFQKSNPQKLHQKLIFDVVNEILAQKMDVSSYCGRFVHMLHSKSFSIKRLYNELCSEIKCLQSCKKENEDENTITRKDAVWYSQAWNSVENEIPALVLEIERLIFKDLIQEVVNGVTEISLDAKQRRQRQMFAKYGI